jgi:hypothetical protein
VDGVLFSKTGPQEKAKSVKAALQAGQGRLSMPKSPRLPQGRLKAMFISSPSCAKLVAA